MFVCFKSEFRIYDSDGVLGKTKQLIVSHVMLVVWRKNEFFLQLRFSAGIYVVGIYLAGNYLRAVKWQIAKRKPKWLNKKRRKEKNILALHNNEWLAKEQRCQICFAFSPSSLPSSCLKAIQLVTKQIHVLGVPISKSYDC